MYLDGDPLLVVWVAEACISCFIDGVFLRNRILHVHVSDAPNLPSCLVLLLQDTASPLAVRQSRVRAFTHLPFILSL